MITITSKLFYDNTREELGKKIAELKRDIVSKLSRLLVFDTAETLEFNYCVLKAKLEVVVFLEYYLLKGTERNWLCTSQTERPIQRMDKLEYLIKETMQNILKKEPSYAVKYNSMYFVLLHYLNRIELKEEEDYGA